MPDKVDVKGWLAIIITVLWGSVTMLSSFQKQEIADVKAAASKQYDEMSGIKISVSQIKSTQDYQTKALEKIIAILEKGGFRVVTAE